MLLGARQWSDTAQLLCDLLVALLKDPALPTDPALPSPPTLPPQRPSTAKPGPSTAQQEPSATRHDSREGEGPSWCQGGHLSSIDAESEVVWPGSEGVEGGLEEGGLDERGLEKRGLEERGLEDRGLEGGEGQEEGPALKKARAGLGVGRLEPEAIALVSNYSPGCLPGRLRLDLEGQG